jgi:hypothetical protein
LPRRLLQLVEKVVLDKPADPLSYLQSHAAQHFA